MSDNAFDLIKRLLQKNPKKRIKIESVLNHKWFKMPLNDYLKNKRNSSIDAGLGDA